MKILHTVEYYSPSVGGAQEVVKQISEHLVRHGHEVTVATSKLANRSFRSLNGVQIEEFDISGNAVRGFKGKTKQYQDFLINGQFDIMMNYAAQQWATDLVFPVLNRIPYKKILIPCGFSALHNPAYTAYFNEMPVVMRGYDYLVFHADHYRDTDLARHHGLTHWSLIPNGALQSDFEHVSTDFRQRYNIPVEVPILLTIGTHTGVKGHRLALEAFRRLEAQRAVLVIIAGTSISTGLWQTTLRPLLFTVKVLLKHLDVDPLISRFRQLVYGGIGSGCLPECRMLVSEINRQYAPAKQVFLLDLPRADVIAALQAANLFIFGSNIEYSPLVLFEAMASKTPFITLACGNAAEIVEWSRGGGVLAPTIQKEQGFVDGDPSIYARLIDELLSNPARLAVMGQMGYDSWMKKFTWERISTQYEDLYQSLL